MSERCEVKDGPQVVRGCTEVKERNPSHSGSIRRCLRRSDQRGVYTFEAWGVVLLSGTI
jgi:hypothetical protein